MDTPDFYKELIRRYKNKTATDKELEIFFQLIREGKIDDALVHDMEKELDRSHNDVVAYRGGRSNGIKRLKYMAAAAVLLVSAWSAYHFLYHTPVHDNISSMAFNHANDVLAGGNKATLILSDGTEIQLDGANIGEIGRQEGVKINKAGDGLLVYYSHNHQNEHKLEQHSTKYHEIATPRGGQYQVVLPDDSKVWLNSDSRLRFPPVFAHHQREVFLEGEAFFEVRPGKQPFIVNTDNQAVRVLGTQFNIKAYLDENTTMTTLVTGSVAVEVQGNTNQNLTLKPNEQAIHSRLAKQVSVVTVDGSEYSAWKDGLFVFNNTDLGEVMNEIARWYDVVVDVEEMPKTKLYAVLPKKVPLSELLEMIAMTSEVRFRIEGRRVCL